jgi:predicted PurR-regulated permease PerM
MMEKNNNAQLILMGLTAAVLYVCYLILRPFITPILFGCVIGIVFYPIHAYTRRFVRSTSGSAAISTFLTFLLTIIPLAFLLVAISNELTDLYQGLAAKSGGAGGLLAHLLRGIDRVVSWISKVFHVQTVDLNAMLTARLESASASLVRVGATVVGNLFSFVSRAAIALVVLFFAFRDGERGVSAILAALPLDEKRASELRSRISSTVTTNVYGGVVVGALQGTLAGLSFWVLGISSPVLWGVVTGVFSLVPIFGSAIIWVPASLALLLTGHFVKAAILLGLGAGLIGTIDNIVRPLIIYKNLRLHPIFVFFSLLGGIQLFGVLGLFVGPVVLSVAAALVVMLREDLVVPDTTKPATEIPAIHVAATRIK